ncbi:MFS general substrate transporter [Xylariaceae sp. AK1471]|nr:MFS general substrate transporter [Xylariaceae sp. AK1471]
MDDPKEDNKSEQIEDLKVEDTGMNSQFMPESLAALTQDDFNKLSRRATLKLDAVMMPILVVMYILNYLDRQNIASARLAGLQEDLGLSNVQYQTAVSILFAGYILTQTPSNLIANKIKWPGVYICAGMAGWGVLSALTALVHNFVGLLVIRVLLGVIEAIFFPGALFLLSQFYNRRQFALRTAILYSGSQIGNAIGGLFAIGVLRLDGERGLSGWRWLFLIEGVLTVFIATVFAFLLPNSNKKIIGLSKIECEFIQWNYSSDLGQEDNSSEITGWQGFVLAFKDPKLWLLTGTLYATYTVGVVVNFFPTVVGGLGYDRTTTYGLTAPPFILCIFIMLFNGWHSDRQEERFLHIVGPLCICLIANIIAVSTLNTGARYFAILILPGSIYGASVVILSWITGSLSQPTAKRAAAIAFINSICNTPNIWGSYLFFSGPRYIVAFVVFIVATGLAIAFAVVTRLYLQRQNAKLDRGESPGKHGPTSAQVASGFRYIL